MTIESRYVISSVRPPDHNVKPAITFDSHNLSHNSSHSLSRPLTGVIIHCNDSTGMYKKYLWLLTDSSAHLMDIYRLVSMHLLLIAVTRVGFDPVMYTVNETEGIVTVCISAMDTPNSESY